MITIEYTQKFVENEPGPNFYWRGSPEDYLRLLNDFHQLGSKTGINISINELDYVHVLEECNILAQSTENGKILCELNDDTVLIDLDCSLWRHILEFFLRISFYPSHYYVEFDHLELIESANFIISSER